MAGFSEDDIRRVREANDLVELFNERTPTRQRGRDFWCCCPFHQEKTPSCKIDPAAQNWHCFGCGEGGDVFSYVQKIEDMNFPEAVRFLAKRGGVTVTEDAATARSTGKKARLREVCAATQDFYHMQLMRSTAPGAAAAREYLAGRGLGGEVPKVWQLGYAPGRRALLQHLRGLGFTQAEMVEANVAFQGQRGVNDRFMDRVMFPIHDARGDCVAFGGRVLGEGEPKYLNSSETPLFHKSEVLYGLDKAKVSMANTGIAVVVEGYTDVIAMHMAGFTNTVATLGTALTRQHIRLLSRHAKNRIVYLFDGDEAGQRAADRALQFIDETIDKAAGTSKIDLCAATLPDGLDPAEFLEARGGEALQQILDAAPELIEFGIERRLERHDLSSPSDKPRALNEALAVLAPIKESYVAKGYATSLADRLGMKPDEVLASLAAIKVAVYDPEAASAAQQQAQQQAPKPQLSPAQRNRLRTEREFLSLCAQNPAMALSFTETLGATRWDEKVHGQLAQVLLDILAVDPNVTAADLLRRAMEQNTHASKVLTSSLTQGIAGAPVYENMRYLADELAIRDSEQDIAAIRELMKNAEMPAEDRDNYLKLIAELQEQLNAKRAGHSPMD